MSEDTNLFLPEDIDLSEDSLNKMDERPTLPEGVTAYFRVVESGNGEYSTGSLYNQLGVVPLRDPTDDTSGMRSYSTRHRTIFPSPNPARPGHKAPNTKGFLVETLRALHGEEVVPRYPAKGKNGGLTYGGQPIDKETAAAIKAKINAAVAEKGKELYKNPDSVVGTCFVATTRKNDRGWIELGRLKPAPDAETVLTDLSDL